MRSASCIMLVPCDRLLGSDVLIDIRRYPPSERGNDVNPVAGIDWLGIEVSAIRGTTGYSIGGQCSSEILLDEVPDYSMVWDEHSAPLGMPYEGLVFSPKTYKELRATPRTMEFIAMYHLQMRLTREEYATAAKQMLDAKPPMLTLMAGKKVDLCVA